MSYIQPKTDFKDGDILYGIDLNASNEVIKAGVDDNFDRIQGLEDSKQDTIDNDNKLDYSLISNTPTIPSKTSDLTNDSGFIDNTYHDDTKQDVLTAGEGIQIENNVISNTQTSAEWGNIQGAIGDQVDLIGLLEDKQNKLISGTNIKTINNQSILGSGNISVGGGSGGTSDYDQLDNRPQINSVTLTGNKSLSDLGINNPTKVSDLTNDAGYITSSYHDNTKQDKIDANNKLPYSYVSGTPTIPTKISDLTNDNNTVTDASYVHTDNNYTSAEKTKLAGIEAGAQVNVDEVLVGDVSSATEDTKLVIEDIDLDFQGSNIVNQYSNSQEDAYSCNYVNRFGKLLWSGNFTEGSIEVPGISQYAVIIVYVLGLVPCIGTRNYGVGGIGQYGGYTTALYNYRLTGAGDTLSINEIAKGGSDGTQNVPITAIFGLF